MIAVQKVAGVYHLFHPSKPRRYTFALVGGAVRMTCYNERGRTQVVLPLKVARGRYGFLRQQGYRKWEEMTCPR